MSDDCISREHLIGEIESLKKSPWFREGEKHKEGLIVDVEHLQYLARKEAVEIVMDLCIIQEKTVKPKERTGEWIEDEEQNHVEKTWHCSECGNIAWGSYEKTTYCCQCGARMKKGGTNEPDCLHKG